MNRPSKIIIFNQILLFCLLFTIICLYYFFVGYKEEILPFMLVMQIVFAILYAFLMLLSIKKLTVANVLLLIFLYNLILSIILRFCFWEYTHLPYGIGADNYTYDDLASVFSSLNYREYLTFILGGGYNIDDLGYPTVLYGMCYIFGSLKLARNAMLVLNALVVVWTCYYLYLWMILLNIKKNYSRFFIAVFGFFPFTVITTSIGLKENIFILIIVGAFYYMYRYKMNHDITSLFLFIIFSISCLFFRIVIPVMLFVTLIVHLLVNDRNKNIFLNIMLLCIIGVAILLDVVISIISPYSLEDIVTVANYRLSMSDGSPFFKWIIQVLSALIGPFPNFNRPAGFGIMNSYGLLFKTMLGLAVWQGVYFVLKNKLFLWYSSFIYILMNLVMVTLAGVSLDMRYHVTFFPVLLPFVAISYQSKILLWKQYAIYIVLVFIFIIIYNGR